MPSSPPASASEKRPPRPPFPAARSASIDSSTASSPPKRTSISWDQASIDNTSSSQAHQRDSSLASLDELMNKDDQAERGLIQSMEHRRSHTQTSGGDVWHASVQGERPPLGGAVPLQFQNLLNTSHTSLQSQADAGSRNSDGSSQNSATKLADIARRMRQKAAAEETITSPNTHHHGHRRAPSTGHRRAPSRAHVLLDSIQEHHSSDDNNLFDGVGTTTLTTDASQESGTTGVAQELAQATTSTEKLITGAMQVEELFEDNGSSGLELVSTPTPKGPPTAETMQSQDDEDDDELAGENLPLMMESPSFVSYQGSIRSATKPPSNRSKNNLPHYQRTDSPKCLRQKAAAKKKSWWWQSLRWTCCHPLELLHRIWHLLWHRSFLLSVAAPCFITAAVLFYWLYNPMWNFLPGHASVAWWLNFIGRQVLLLELARVWQWIFIDNLVLGTRIAVQCLGPLLTLCLIQARGWPFTMATWGFLDLILLSGSSGFEQHWLNFGPLAIYQKGENDSGSYVLSSGLYIRLLLCMILAGIATAGKRTAVAMYFGRRTFLQFKPRLEKLLKDVVLVTEMAALAEEAEIVAAEEREQERLMAARRHSRGSVLVDGGRVSFLGDVTWSNNTRRRKSKTTADRTVTFNATSEDATDSEDDESEITTQHDIQTEAERLQLRQTQNERLHDLLLHWDEPVNKLDKSLNASISDILRFRRALTFMDDVEPFGQHFGPASNRDQLIHSAQAVYNRLLKLTPGRSKLSCEFYDMLALEGDGETVNVGKRKAIRKLFRPDASNELSLLAFVQCCDSLYKKLRYFRANVGNASVIDHALESIVDGAFSFVLALVLLSVMRINPWPLLVSISTLLVSVSFAVGSSASKWFEGMLLVAARRPFDLGDRIYMTEPSLIVTDGLWYCWFIEDINLFHTTVRYAGTNEVATINNGSVANLRIINGARSPNAAVWFQFPYRPNLMEDGNLDKLKAGLEKYGRDNPRNWHSYTYCRVDEVHPELEKLVVTIGFQHRSPWQDLVTILEAKARLMCWTLEYGRKLGINYDQLPQRDLLYYAGALKDGGVDRHRFQIHNPSNVVSTGVIPSPPSISRGIPRSPTAQESSNANFLAQLMQSHG